jgi:hypothetical protein
MHLGVVRIPQGPVAATQTFPVVKSGGKDTLTFSDVEVRGPGLPLIRTPAGTVQV